MAIVKTVRADSRAGIAALEGLERRRLAEAEAA